MLKITFPNDYPKSYPVIEMDDYYKQDSILSFEKSLATQIIDQVNTWKEYEKLTNECDAKNLLSIFSKINQIMEKVYISVSAE